MSFINVNSISSDLLRTFVAVVETGNVTVAAGRIGRTQSAISLQIKKLEAALGVELFERGARGMALSDQGRKLLPAARRVLAELERVGDLFSTELTGRIRVGIPDDYNDTILEAALGEFSTRHGSVEVYVRSGCTAGFPHAIHRGELDIALYSAEFGKTDDTLFSEPTVWAAAKDFQINPSEPLPLALFDRDCRWRDLPAQALDAVGRAWRIAYSSENFVSVKTAISAGLGIGVLAKSALQDSMRVLRTSEGFPALPNSSLRLLKREDRDDQIIHAMQQAIIGAVGNRTDLIASVG